MWFSIWSMNWSWCYIAYSMWKAPNCTGVHFNYSNRNNSCNSASSTYSLNWISRNQKRKGNKQEATQPNTNMIMTLSCHRRNFNHHTFLVALKLVAIQVMDRHRDTCICRTGLVHAGFFLLRCVHQCGTCSWWLGGSPWRRCGQGGTRISANPSLCDDWRH